MSATARLAVATLLLAIAGIGTAEGWQIVPVDTQGGEYTSIVIDSEDVPHIIWYNNVQQALRHAWKEGSSWQYGAVDTGDNVGWWTSLAVDSRDGLHASYQDYPGDGLRYAYWDGSSWAVEEVVSGDYGYDYTSIALDPNDVPHIACRFYETFGSTHLVHAWMDGAEGWQLETVDDQGAVGAWASIAVDSGGHPHIAYYDGTNGDLKYALWDGSDWHLETVDSEGITGMWCSLALDSQDRPRVSYMDYSDYDLRYAAWNGSAWQLETVDGAGSVGQFTSLELDDDGHPHISYKDYTGEDLEYACWDGSAWQLTTVHSQLNTGSWTSLALDSRGLPHISYEYNWYGDLYYAWFEMPQGAGEAPGASGYSAGPPAPNPCRGTCSVRFTMPERGVVSVSVFDTTGRLVESRGMGTYSCGTHEAVIGGLDPGVYVYRLEAGAGGAFTGRLVVTR